MKWISYSRYTGEDLGLSAEDLMRALSDFFLQSGFEYQYMSFNEMDKHSLERLKEASSRRFVTATCSTSRCARQCSRSWRTCLQQEMEGLVDRLIQKLRRTAISTSQDEKVGRGRQG